MENKDFLGGGGTRSFKFWKHFSTNINCFPVIEENRKNYPKKKKIITITLCIFDVA